jgi:hypothetical protein
MANIAKKALEKLPGYSVGVRAGAALRDITLGQPVCPNSQIRGKIVNGNYEAPELGPGLENCQLARGEWWIDCAQRGHDPYYRTIRMYHTVDIEEVDEETGDVYVVGTKRKVRVVKTINATQVSPSITHNSGQGVARKIKYLGYRRLKDLGFAEVCQYRACQKEPAYRSEGLGDYCSLEHLNLVAAREDGEFLSITDTQGLNAGYEAQSEKKRRKQLQETMPRNVEKLKATG